MKWTGTGRGRIQSRGEVPAEIAVCKERNDLRGTRFVDQTLGPQWPWKHRHCGVDGWAAAAAPEATAAPVAPENIISDRLCSSATANPPASTDGARGQGHPSSR